MMIVKMPALSAMTNATATGGSSQKLGVYNSSSSTSRTSSISGTTNSIFNIGTDPSASAQVADTALGGSVTSGEFTCVGVYGADLLPSAINATDQRRVKVEG